MKFCDHVWVWEGKLSLRRSKFTYFLSISFNYCFIPLSLFLSPSAHVSLSQTSRLMLSDSPSLSYSPPTTLPLPSISEWQNSLFEYLKRFSFNHSIFFTLGNSYPYYLTFVPFILYWNHILFFSAVFSILFFVDKITSIHYWFFFLPGFLFTFIFFALWIPSEHFINV